MKEIRFQLRRQPNQKCEHENDYSIQLSLSSNPQKTTKINSRYQCTSTKGLTAGSTKERCQSPRQRKSWPKSESRDRFFNFGSQFLDTVNALQLGRRILTLASYTTEKRAEVAQTIRHHNTVSREDCKTAASTLSANGSTQQPHKFTWK